MALRIPSPRTSACRIGARPGRPPVNGREPPIPIGASGPVREIVPPRTVPGVRRPGHGMFYCVTMNVIETQPERVDLPLVVLPVSIASMIEPFRGNLSLLHDVARVRMHQDFTLDEDTIVSRCAGADAVMVIGFHVTDSILERLGDHVRCFAFGGTGVASYIDLARTRALGIRVCNVVHYGDNAVAEHALALIMELSRHVGDLDRSVHMGAWTGTDGLALHGRTMGLVGFGGIGQAMARIARGLGMRTLVWNSHVDAEAARSLKATPVEDLGDLFERSDIVSLHLPYTASTRGIVTGRHLSRLRPGGMLINTARAEIVERGALQARLQAGDIMAGLDVFDQEPLAPDDPLLSMPGVVLTPHVAWRTDEAYVSLTRQVVRAIASFFDGGTFNAVA